METPDAEIITVKDVEMALEFIAILTVYVSPKYAKWIGILERALDEARKDDPIARVEKYLPARREKVA